MTHVEHLIDEARKSISLGRLPAKYQDAEVQPTAAIKETEPMPNRTDVKDLPASRARIAEAIMADTEEQPKRVIAEEKDATVKKIANVKPDDLRTIKQSLAMDSELTSANLRSDAEIKRKQAQLKELITQSKVSPHRRKPHLTRLGAPSILKTKMTQRQAQKRVLR